jgi:hypothetical protein
MYTNQCCLSPSHLECSVADLTIQHLEQTTSCHNDNDNDLLMY